uniref:Uncharacterized protein n=1 Tax=Cacopsylla melanoneura TaxID=428564 RepID=A0A8D8VZZ2_9HEMI
MCSYGKMSGGVYFVLASVYIMCNNSGVRKCLCRRVFNVLRLTGHISVSKIFAGRQMLKGKWPRISGKIEKRGASLKHYKALWKTSLVCMNVFPYLINSSRENLTHTPAVNDGLVFHVTRISLVCSCSYVCCCEGIRIVYCVVVC